MHRIVYVYVQLTEGVAELFARMLSAFVTKMSADQNGRKLQCTASLHASPSPLLLGLIADVILPCAGAI